MNVDQNVISALGQLPHHEHPVAVQVLEFFNDDNDVGKPKAKIAFAQKFENGLLTDWLGRHNSNIGFGTDEFIVPAHCILRSIFPDDEEMTAREKMRRGSVVAIADIYNLNGVQYLFRSVRSVELSSQVLMESKGSLIPVKIVFTGIRRDHVHLGQGEKQMVAIVETSLRDAGVAATAQVWYGTLQEMGTSTFCCRFCQLYHPRDVQRLEAESEKYNFEKAEVTMASDGHRVAELFFSSTNPKHTPKPDVATALVPHCEEKKEAVPLEEPSSASTKSKPDTAAADDKKAQQANKEQKTNPDSENSPLESKIVPGKEDPHEKANGTAMPAETKNTPTMKKLEHEKSDKNNNFNAGPIIIEDKIPTPKSTTKPSLCGRIWSILCCRCT